MKREIEVQVPSEKNLQKMFSYIIDGKRISPFFSTKTVCEAFVKKHDELSKSLEKAKIQLKSYVENDNKRGMILCNKYLIPEIEDKIHRFLQEVESGVFEKKILHIL